MAVTFRSFSLFFLFGAMDVEGDTALNERMINEEYKIWKKNTPYLYVVLGAENRGDQ